MDKLHKGCNNIYLWTHCVAMGREYCSGRPSCIARVADKCCNGRPSCVAWRTRKCCNGKEPCCVAMGEGALHCSGGWSTGQLKHCNGRRNIAMADGTLQRWIDHCTSGWNIAYNRWMDCTKDIAVFTGGTHYHEWRTT